MRVLAFVFAFVVALPAQVSICTLQGDWIFLRDPVGPGTWAAATRIATATWQIRDCAGVWTTITGVETPRSFDDVDGDGWTDVMVTLPNSDTGVVSAASLSLQWAGPPSLAQMEDVTGDGIADLWRVVGPSTDIFSGATGALAYNLPFVVRDTCGDFDGDGRADILTDQGVRSGTTGAVLAPFMGTPGPVGDVNGDGYADVLVRQQVSSWCEDFTWIVYGPDGSVVSNTLPDANLFPVGRLGDIDGDGGDDWLGVHGDCVGGSDYRLFSGSIWYDLGLGLTSTQSPEVFVLSDVDGDGVRDFAIGGSSGWGGNDAHVFSTVIQLPSTSATPACPGPHPGLVVQGGPVVGQLVSFRLTGATPFAAATVYLGAAAPPVPILGNCALHLDPSSAVAVGSGMVNSTGNWVHYFGDVPIEGFVGVTLTAQAFAVSAATGWQASEAVTATIGSSYAPVASGF